MTTVARQHYVAPGGPIRRHLEALWASTRDRHLPMTFDLVDDYGGLWHCEACHPLPFRVYATKAGTKGKTIRTRRAFDAGISDPHGWRVPV